MNGIQTLKLNKDAYRLYQKAGKLSKLSRETRQFMTNAANNIPIGSRELVDLFDTLIFVVDKTQIFPSEAQFRVKTGNKVIYLNSSGDFLEQRLLIDDTQINSSRNRGPIRLSPALEMEAVDFSTFISGYFRGHLSAPVLRELCTVPEPLNVVWNIPLIRTIYLRFSNPRWSPPLEAMEEVQRYLINRGLPRNYVRLIENCLVNGARLGYSPVDVLKKTVLPQLERFGENPENFREAMGLQWSMTRRLNALFGKDNDGTDFNQYSLRKLIIPIAAPDSRFAMELDLNETDRLFTDIAIRWKEVFTAPYRFTKDLFDNYGDHYLSNVCRNETPEVIRREIIRLLNHMDFISSRIEDEKQYTRFLKPLHVQGFEEIKKKSAAGNIQAALRLIMQKHFEIIEEYTILDFPIDYRQYMTFFSGGFIQTPDDIDFFQSAVRNIRKLNSSETSEILKVMMLYASDVKETQKVIDYISSCKIFDREIFQKWKDLREDHQDEAIYSLNKIFDRYILDPSVEVAVRELPRIERVIEFAIIKQLVKSPRLGRQDVDNMLHNETTAMEPEIPGEFLKAEEFQVRLRHFGNRSIPDQDFASLRHRFVNRTYTMFNDEHYRDRVASSIIKAGVYYFGSAYGDTSVQIMNNFQLFAGEINNLTGQAAEVGRECSSWILIQEEELAGKTIGMMEELVLSGIMKKAGISQLAYPPFSEVLEKPERDSFTVQTLLPLGDIYGIYLREYILDFCMNSTELLPPVARTLFQKSFPGTESLMECASIIISSFSKHLNLESFDECIKNLSGENTEKRMRKIRLIGGKRKVDQFFHIIGETGHRDLFNEIKRKDFIPIRIIDAEDMKIAGYVTTFLAYPSNSRNRILILTGIHVQANWFHHMDELFFYRECRKALVNFAKRVDADLLCVTLTGENHSGSASLRSLIKADLDEKPVIKTAAVLTFPEKSFPFSEVAVLWKKKSG